MIALHQNKNFLFGLFSILFIIVAALAALDNQYYFLAAPFALLFFYAGWQRPGVLFLLLVFTLPFSTEYQVTPALGTDLPDELLMLLTAVLFTCACLYQPRILPKETVTHPLVLLLLIGFCWAVISSLFSAQPLLSLKFILAKTWYLGAFVLAPLVVFREKRQVSKAIYLLAIGMIAVACIALLRHWSHGFTFATINEAVYPFFRNHVNYSAMLVCLLPVVMMYWHVKKKGVSKNVTAAVLGILLIALFFSYARGAWLALLTGIAAVWLIRKKKLVAAYLIVIVLLLLSLAWLQHNDRYLRYAHDYRTTIWHDDFRDHLAATYRFKDMSTAERFYRWIAGVRMVKDNWLTGYGPNSFYYTYKPYAVPAFRTWVSDNKEHSTVHNYFLLIVVEQGIPGLLFFLLLNGAMLFYAQRLYHQAWDLFYKRIAMVTGVVVVMILTVNFLSDLIETDKIGSLFLLCLSLLVIADVAIKKKEIH